MSTLRLTGGPDSIESVADVRQAIECIPVSAGCFDLAEADTQEIYLAVLRHVAAGHPDGRAMAVVATGLNDRWRERHEEWKKRDAAMTARRDELVRNAHRLADLEAKRLGPEAVCADVVGCDERGSFGRT